MPRIPPALLARKSARPGFAYGLKDRLAYVDVGGEVLVEEADDSALSIPAVISTVSRDRVGDVVEPKGCQLSDYAKNPVVFYGHQQVSGFELPIGVSENPATSALDVIIRDGDILATCYFHQHTRQATEVYLLVKHRIIRGTSIGFDPTEEPERLPVTDRFASGGHRFPGWSLLEWSFVGVPANPECVSEQRELARAAISRGRVGGERLSKSILKSLEPLAGPKIAWSAGHSPLDSFLGADIMSHRWGKTKSRKALNAESGTDGGYATAAQTSDADETPAHMDTMLSGVCRVMKEHEPDAPASGPHDAFVQKSSGAVHHHHHPMAHVSHLKAVADGLHDVEGVKSVSQGTELPGGSVDQNEGGKEGWEQVYQHGGGDPPGQDGDESKALLSKHARRGLVLKSMAAMIPAQVRSALEDCVQRKIPKIADDHPEMSEEQRVAVAYSMCGEKALALKEFPEEEDAAEDEPQAEAEGAGEGSGDLAALIAQLTEAIVAIQEKIKPAKVEVPEPEEDEDEEEDGEAQHEEEDIPDRYTEAPKGARPRLTKSMRQRRMQVMKEAADHLHGAARQQCKACHKYHSLSFGHARAMDALLGAEATENEKDDMPPEDGTPEQGGGAVEEPNEETGEAKGFDLDKLLSGLDTLDKRLDNLPRSVFAITGQRN